MDLLHQWRNIYQEAVHLAEEIERLPDACECGDGDGHLSGRCPCCAAYEPDDTRHGSRENCNEILDRLRADLAMLCEDFATLAGPMKAVVLEAQSWEVRRGIFLAGGDLQKIVEAFARIGEAVVGFRRTCALAEMRGLKRRCVEMRMHCEQLNNELFGG